MIICNGVTTNSKLILSLLVLVLKMNKDSVRFVAQIVWNLAKILIRIYTPVLSNVKKTR